MATRTISTKLAVEGEAQYKQAIAACNSELSTLKSGLSLVESEFRNNANSMEALTAKGSALDSMYSKQKEKVSTLEEAIKNCQRAQEEYSSRVATAKENIERCEKALDELKNSTGDTSEEQAALTAELDKWNAELTEAEAGQAAAERGVQNWQKQLNTAKVELNGLSDEIDKNNGYLEEAKESADGCATSIDEFGNEVKDSKEGINALASALAAAGIAKTVKEIADSLMECAEAAASFETAMAKVSTLADTSVVPMESLKTQLISLSSETGVAVESLAEATYQALSAGVDTADVVSFVATATKTSVAGFTDSSTAVDVLTTALNAYKLEGSETERVASMLVKTQDEGKTSVGELAANMGRVIPTAAAYNVSLENLTTAYALLTKNSTNTALSTTNLAAMFDELAKNGSKVSDILQEETGKSFSQLMGSGSTLSDVLIILSDTVGNDETAFSNLWGSTNAGKAALTLLQAGAEEFDNTLEKMANSSGTVERNFQTMADTTEFAHKRMETAAQNLKIAIGDQLNPALEKLYDTGADAFTWAAEFASEHPEVVKALAAVTLGIGTLAAGITLAANAANIATVATTLLNAAMDANPALLLAAGITALVVAIGAFVMSLDDADESTREFISGLEETKAAYEELSEAMEEDQAATAATAASLEELLAVEEKSAIQKDLIAKKVDELNEKVPGLGLAYDSTKDSINMTTEALDALLERSAAHETYESQVARISELYDEQTEITNRLEEARTALSTAEETGSGNTRELQNNVNELTAALEDNQAQIKALEKEAEEYGAWQKKSQDATKEMQSTVSDLISEMKALQASYDESYNSAMESIEGQLGLFNKLDGTSKTTIGDLIETLQGQVDYMETYASNIKKAMELGVDEGLIKKLSDGSEESAQILAAIVEGGTEEIKALNEQLARVEEGKESFSDTVAEMETDFDEKMKNIERRMQKAIDELDMSIEAGDAGANTIQGYIDGAEGMRGQLVATYKSIARAANNAYQSTLDIHSPSRVFEGHGKNTIRGAIVGAEEEKPDLEAAYAALAESASKAYERALPSSIEEPPAAEAVGRQAAAIVAAMSGNGGGGVVNQFHIDKLEVRDDRDIERIARELYLLQQRESRSRGGGAL